MALNCEVAAAGSSGAACGICESCRRVAGGLHPDVVTFASEGAQILMEQAQEIVALGQRRPHEGRARVVIVDGADCMNVNASNCLLKTLEEPTAGNHLILVTSAPDRLLATIRSRCQRVRFRSVLPAALLDLGQRRGIDTSSADVRVAAVVAAGSVSRFLELATNTGDREIRDAAALLRQAAQGRGIAPILDAAAELGDKESKHRLPDALSLLARVYRDALVTAVGAPDLAVLGAADARAATSDPVDGQPLAPPTELPVSGLGRALGAVLEAEAALAGNVNPVMAIEHLLLNLRREERVTG
jgi:DNA polymerase-3 subunit delta'